MNTKRKLRKIRKVVKTKKKGGSNKIEIVLKDCLKDDVSGSFQSGNFVSKFKFCQLLNKHDNKYLCMNFGESLIGTSFLSGSTLMQSIKLISIICAFIGSNYRDEMPSTLEELYFFPKENEVGKEKLIATSLICNEYYESLFNDLFYYILKNDINNISGDPDLSQDTFNEKTRNFNPFFEFINYVGTDNIFNTIDLYSDIDYEDEAIYIIPELFDLIDKSISNVSVENEAEEIRVELKEDFLPIEQKWYEQQSAGIIKQNKPYQIFIFGLGPSGLIMAASLIKMAIKFNIFINLVLVENRIEHEGYKKEYSREHKISITVDINSMDEDQGEELFTRLYNSLDNKIQTKFLERRFANFIHNFYKISKDKPEVYKIQIRRLYRKFNSHNIKNFINNGFMGLQKIPTLILNCSSKSQIIGAKNAIFDERLSKIDPSFIENYNEDKKRLYLIGELYYYYLKIKDTCDYSNFNKFCQKKSIIIHNMGFLASKENIFKNITNKEQLIQIIKEKCNN